MRPPPCADAQPRRYQSTFLGSYQTLELIETFLTFQDSIKRCVCLVYDPVRSLQGAPVLKALRLTDAFMELYRGSEMTAAQLAEKGLVWSDVFASVPVTVVNSPLAAAQLQLCLPPAMASAADFDTLSLSAHPFLARWGAVWRREPAS